ncbi:MAG: aminotransferase class V-fold PLP-dependent enzyme [Chitinophagales bacterium]
MHVMDHGIETGVCFEEENFITLRNKEYPYLDEQSQVYLDFTGGNLCPVSLLDKHHALLRNNILGNPHSTNPTSQLSTKLVEEARQKVLSFFRAEDYICIFTKNASGALKIVGESYPFHADSSFVLTGDNHNSVNGIRSFCQAKGGTTKYIGIQYEDLQIDAENAIQILQTGDPEAHNLFAFPAQSNVSGVKHDLGWIEKAEDLGYDVLLDAAAFVPTSVLDLSKVHPAFVVISFYKMFGYPTGIGCLLVHKKAYHKLQKPWFAGGTVKVVSVADQHQILAEGHEKFEDGTLNYAGIPAITFGLEYLESIGMDRINQRVLSLIQYVYTKLTALQHANGVHVVKIFGPEHFNNHGGNIIMNFCNAEGRIIPYMEFEELANAHNISIRSGCFCNPGIDEINNCITGEEMAGYFSSREDGDYNDMVKYLGKLRGAIRLSVGIATTQKDLDTFIALVDSLRN